MKVLPAIIVIITVLHAGVPVDFRKYRYQKVPQNSQGETDTEFF